MQDKITGALLALLAMLIVAAAYDIGMSKQETIDCIKWQDQANEFSGFYLTQNEADQCRDHNIVINAPIR